jgi:hypothetical protein
MPAKKNDKETKVKKIVAEEVSLDTLSVEEKKPAPKKQYINHDNDEEDDGDWGMPSKKIP